MRKVSRRQFLGLAGAAAATAALPRPLLALELPPAEVEVAAIQYELGDGMLLNLTQTYLQFYGVQYLVTRFLSDSGMVLEERVRELRPCEEVTIARIGERS